MVNNILDDLDEDETIALINGSLQGIKHSLRNMDSKMALVKEQIKGGIPIEDEYNRLSEEYDDLQNDEMELEILVNKLKNK